MFLSIQFNSFSFDCTILWKSFLPISSINSKGYLLADDDYDVWLGNTRGNIYSCNHTTYDPFGESVERELFWSFSWHEMGITDLPAMIDYVLDKTGEEKLQYIGHSQGTTAFFVMASKLPKYNDKIEMMHALAPVAFLSNAFSPPIRAIAPFVSVVKVRIQIEFENLILILFVILYSTVFILQSSNTDVYQTCFFLFLLGSNFTNRYVWCKAHQWFFKDGWRSYVPRSSAHTDNMLEYVVFDDGLWIGSIE